MTREELRDYVDEQRTLDNIPYHVYSALIDGIDALEQEPCDDAISRQAVMDCFKKWQPYMATRLWDFEQELSKLPPVKPQEPKTEQFAKWVASEIFDEWEYNKDSFAEIACRKLATLGIVRAKGDEWELVEPQERSE